MYIPSRLCEPREAVFCYQGTRALSLVVLKGAPCCILPSSLSPRTGHGRDAGELGWEPLPLVWSQWREPGLGFLPVLSSSGLAPSPPGRLSFVLTAPRTVQLSLTSCPCLGSLCVVSASVRSQFWYLTAVRLPDNLGGACVAVLKLGTGLGPGEVVSFRVVLCFPSFLSFRMSLSGWDLWQCLLRVG